MNRKVLLTTFVSIVGTCQVMAQQVVSFRESQARLSEPNMGVYIKPLIADLKINSTAGKIRDKWDFSLQDIKALKGEIPNLKARALFLSTEKHDADVIVAASFDIVSKDDGSGFVVRVIGYPANYINWRTATTEDNAWIQNERLAPAKAQQTTQAITK